MSPLRRRLLELYKMPVTSLRIEFIKDLIDNYGMRDRYMVKESTITPISIRNMISDELDYLDGKANAILSRHIALLKKYKESLIVSYAKGTDLNGKVIDLINLLSTIPDTYNTNNKIVNGLPITLQKYVGRPLTDVTKDINALCNIQKKIHDICLPVLRYSRIEDHHNAYTKLIDDYKKSTPDTFKQIGHTVLYMSENIIIYVSDDKGLGSRSTLVPLAYSKIPTPRQTIQDIQDALQRLDSITNTLTSRYLDAISTSKLIDNIIANISPSDGDIDIGHEDMHNYLMTSLDYSDRFYDTALLLTKELLEYIEYVLRN